MKSLIRYYHTLRYLTFTQIYFQLYYKVRRIFRRYIGYKPKYTLYKKGRKLQFVTPWIDKPNSYKGNNVFEFLNVKADFSGLWDSRAQGDLWRYNLNYMDYLLQPEMTVVKGYEWIQCFIEGLPNNTIAADAYPISLRGINWIKFVSRNYDSLTPQQIEYIDIALYSQYKILLESVERHLMANHYLENGLSLLYAACYFEDSKFYKASEEILFSQLNEQVLSDGAHFELSPMYHCIILDRMLDCYNVIDKVKHPNLAVFLQTKISLMLGWLDAVVMCDDSIPLLNDSAYGIAPSPQELRAYAKELGIKWNVGELKTCGYRRFKTACYDVLVDVAPLGPSYNLGHAHADTLNFIMHVHGSPFIVDSGISTYSICERRCYERSTMAHNTISINESNSSDVWASFRCAKRASVLVVVDENCHVKAEHDGYATWGVKCVRDFVKYNDMFEVTDTLEGALGQKAFSRLHLSPKVEVHYVKEDQVYTSMGVIRFKGAVEIHVEEVEIASQYNLLQPSKCICVEFTNCLLTSIIPN